MDMNSVLDWLTVGLLGLGSIVLATARAAATEAAKVGAAEGAKQAIAQVTWPAELARELQKARGLERQELRFKCYGTLWAALRPLALYDPRPINREAARTLSIALSDWYFSDCGGLLLSVQVRDFYFALQDLLRTTSTTNSDWHVERSLEDQNAILRTVLAPSGAAAQVLDYFTAGDFRDWQQRGEVVAKAWREGIRGLAASWDQLTSAQRFATLQQSGSLLRTSLTNDVESRLE